MFLLHLDSINQWLSGCILLNIDSWTQYLHVSTCACNRIYAVYNCLIQFAGKNKLLIYSAFHCGLPINVDLPCPVDVIVNKVATCTNMAARNISLHKT